MIPRSRKPAALAALSRRAGPMRDRRAPRGGAQERLRACRRCNGTGEAPASEYACCPSCLGRGTSAEDED